MTLPQTIFTGEFNTGHIQGIAPDTERRYIYYSFTTLLVKAELSTGKVVGSVGGLVGHLGCIDFSDATGKLLGTIEYKHDAIGRGIEARTGVSLAEEDAFYIGVFDVDKIDRPGMDAERDGILRAAYLPDVIEDYEATLPSGKKHRYGCSGIDGITVGKPFGAESGAAPRVYVAYGIYSDLERDDNDCQILLEFDPEKVEKAARPLCQSAPHHEGLRADRRLFLYTGNTTYGVQNLEYDEASGDYLVAVYPGEKPRYPNPPLFLIDGKLSPVLSDLPGIPGEKGLLLSLKNPEKRDTGDPFPGLSFPYGSTGVCSLGDGRFYFSEEKRRKSEDGKIFDSSVIRLYRRDENAEEGFVPLEE